MGYLANLFNGKKLGNVLDTFKEIRIHKIDAKYAFKTAKVDDKYYAANQLANQGIDSQHNTFMDALPSMFQSVGGTVSNLFGNGKGALGQSITPGNSNIIVYVLGAVAVLFMFMTIRKK